MTKKTALIVACNIMSDTLYDMESEFGVKEARSDSYYKQVQEAIEILGRMLDEEV